MKKILAAVLPLTLLAVFATPPSRANGDGAVKSRCSKFPEANNRDAYKNYAMWEKINTELAALGLPKNTKLVIPADLSTTGPANENFAKFKAWCEDAYWKALLSKKLLPPARGTDTNTDINGHNGTIQRLYMSMTLESFLIADTQTALIEDKADEIDADAKSIIAGLDSNKTVSKEKIEKVIELLPKFLSLEAKINEKPYNIAGGALVESDPAELLKAGTHFKGEGSLDAILAGHLPSPILSRAVRTPYSKGQDEWKKLEIANKQKELTVGLKPLNADIDTRNTAALVKALTALNTVFAKVKENEAVLALKKDEKPIPKLIKLLKRRAKDAPAGTGADKDLEAQDRAKHIAAATQGLNGALNETILQRVFDNLQKHPDQKFLVKDFTPDAHGFAAWKKSNPAFMADIIKRARAGDGGGAFIGGEGNEIFYKRPGKEPIKITLPKFDKSSGEEYTAAIQGIAASLVRGEKPKAERQAIIAAIRERLTDPLGTGKDAAEKPTSSVGPLGMAVEGQTQQELKDKARNKISADAAGRSVARQRIYNTATAAIEAAKKERDADINACIEKYLRDERGKEHCIKGPLGAERPEGALKRFEKAKREALLAAHSAIGKDGVGDPSKEEARRRDLLEAQTGAFAAHWKAKFEDLFPKSKDYLKARVKASGSGYSDITDDDVDAYFTKYWTAGSTAKDLDGFLNYETRVGKIRAEANGARIGKMPGIINEAVETHFKANFADAHMKKYGDLRAADRTKYLGSSGVLDIEEAVRNAK